MDLLVLGFYCSAVGLSCLLCKTTGREILDQSVCFLTDETIGGHDKQREVTFLIQVEFILLFVFAGVLLLCILFLSPGWS